MQQVTKLQKNTCDPCYNNFMEKKDSIELIDERWDKKKIILAVLLLFLFAGTAYAVKKYILGDEITSSVRKSVVKSGSEVAGASTENKSTESTENKKQPPPFSFSSSVIQETVQEKFSALKNQVTNLSVDEIASASPQVQKILNDFKALQEYPKNQAKEFCENMCKSL